MTWKWFGNHLEMVWKSAGWMAGWLAGWLRTLFVYIYIYIYIYMFMHLGTTKSTWERPNRSIWGRSGLAWIPRLSWILLGSPGLSWALLGSPGLSWAPLGYSGVSWALVGSPGLSWALQSPGDTRRGQERHTNTHTKHNNTPTHQHTIYVHTNRSGGRRFRNSWRWR